MKELQTLLHQEMKERKREREHIPVPKRQMMSYHQMEWKLNLCFQQTSNENKIEYSDRSMRLIAQFMQQIKERITGLRMYRIL